MIHISVYLFTVMHSIALSKTVRDRGLPNNIETGSIEMPRLHSCFVVLEDDFNEVMKCESNDRGARLGRSTLSGLVLDGVEIKDTRDVKPVSKLQWRRWIHIGDPINSISKLAVYLCCCIL